MTGSYASARNASLLQNYNEKYPHTCKTAESCSRNRQIMLRPETVKAKLPGCNFIRLPLYDYTHWGFTNAADLQEFKAEFPDLILEPRS